MDDELRDELGFVRMECRRMRDALQQGDAISAEVHSERAIKAIDRVLGFGAPSGEEVRRG